jgi:Rrf2 family protein
VNLLTRNTDYAVRALIYMAGKDPARVSTADLDRDLHLPRPFMRTILQELQKAGYLLSVKGRNGGFTLAKPPEKIPLTGLIALFQGPVSMGDCLFKEKLCDCAHSCPLRHEIKAIEAMASARLKAVTISSLMKR